MTPFRRAAASIGGAAGTLALLPIARGLGLRLGSSPQIAGAEARAGDVKLATAFELAVCLVAVPLAAYFFGWLLPSRLSMRFPVDPDLSFLPGCGFAASLLLWHRGFRPRHALLAAAAVAVLLALVAILFGLYPNARSRLASLPRSALALVFCACAALGVVTAAAWPSALDPLLREIVFATFAAGIVLTAALHAGDLSGRTRALHEGAVAALVACAAAFFLPRAMVPLVIAGWLALAILAFRAPDRPGRFGRAALVLFLLACGWRVRYYRDGPVDIFEDGHSLAPAQAYRHGARPYLDTYPIHGWGIDGGVDGLAFRLFSPAISTYRLRTAISTAPALAFLAISSVLVLGTGLWGFAGLLLALSICPFLAERQMPLFATLCLFAAGIQAQRRSLIAGSGAAAAITLFFSLDVGLFVTGGCLAALGAGSLAQRKDGLRRIGIWIAGFAAGAFPFAVLLALRGCLGDFLRVSFLDLPRVVGDAWGLPESPLAAALAEPQSLSRVAQELAAGGASILPLLLVAAVGLTLLLVRVVRREADSADVAASAFLFTAVVSLRGIAGRADEGHWQIYGILFAIPAAWIASRLAHAGHRGAAAAGFACLLLRLHPLGAIDAQLNALTRPRPAYSGAKAFATGASLLPPAQAGEVTELKSFLDLRLAVSGTYFDFSNEPALYFLLGRIPPVPYLMVPIMEPIGRQEEIIRRLETASPGAVILASGTDSDAFDGVPNAERAPLLARYLDRAYPRRVVVAGRVIGLRGCVRGSPALSSRLPEWPR
jgi:hypothetical protein